ncbi:unnamed protein product, partial [Ectocarpus sp. 13 AM-2016]
MDGGSHGWGAQHCERWALSACVPGIPGVDRGCRRCSEGPGEAQGADVPVRFPHQRLDSARPPGRSPRQVKPMKDFVATTNDLAAFAAKWAKGGRCRAPFATAATGALSPTSRRVCAPSATTSLWWTGWSTTSFC